MRICKRFRPAIFLLLVFAVTTISASAQTDKPRPGAKIRGENYSYKLYDEDFVNTPDWQADQGEPPVSVSRAMQIAKANLARFVTGAEKFKVRRIMLVPYGMNDKWYYSLSFVCRAKGCRELDVRNFVMIVKMNESIVEPKILPPDF